MKKIVLLLFIFFALLFVLIFATIFPHSPTWVAEDYRYSSWNWETNTTFVGGYGECVASDGEDIYILKQYHSSSTTYFYKYHDSSWVDLSDNLPDVDFKNGVAMAYDYSGNFYVLNGSSYSDGASQVGFFKYNISADSWISLSSTPHVQGAGDAIVYSLYDHMVYAFMGRAHYTGEYKPPDGIYGVFARYDPGEDSWVNLSYPPWEGTDDGASLAWTGDRYIYALQGEFLENSPIRSFARYDIETDTWENMTDIPSHDGVGDGGSLLWIGEYEPSYSDVIFAFDGNGCNETPGYNFTMYSISDDSWTKINEFQDAPIGDYVGNRLVYSGGKLWYWQGTPSTWTGGGKGVYSYDYSEIVVPEIDLSLFSLLFPVIMFSVWLFRERT